MGYRIVYGADPFPQQPGHKSRLRLLTAAFALAFVAAVRCFWPEGTQMLRAVLLPGDNATFVQLTEEIRAGAPVGDAVTAFCSSIVEEAVEQAD